MSAMKGASATHSIHERAVMKGRRKVSTSKWFLKAKFEAEAQRISASRSKNVANRFLDAALQFGAEYEPTGRLAGGSNPAAPQDD